MSIPGSTTLTLRAARLFALTGAITAFTLTPPPAPAQARGEDPSQQRARVAAAIDDSRGELADLSAESARALLALRRTQAGVARARAAAQSAAVDLAAARANTAEVGAALRAAQAREAAGLAALRRNADATQSAGDRRDALARVAYESGGSAEVVALSGFVDLESAGDVAERAHLVARAGAHETAVVQELRAARVQRLAEQERLEAARREVAQLMLRAQAAQARADAAADAAARRSAELATLARRQQREQAQVEARRGQETARLADLQAESDRLAAQLRERARANTTYARGQARTSTTGTSTTGTSATGTSTRGTYSASAAGGTSRSARPRDAGGRLASPVAAPLTSPFGMRMHPILGYARLHAGVDFGAACGAPVYAAADGEVVRTGWAGGYGNQIVIGHGGSLATSYNHLSSIAVGGGRVERGQFIGRVGTTGLSTGCHLHFETRVDGRPVNPAPYL